MIWDITQGLLLSAKPAGTGRQGIWLGPENNVQPVRDQLLQVLVRGPGG